MEQEAKIISFPAPDEVEKVKLERRFKEVKIRDFINNPQKVPAFVVRKIVEKIQNKKTNFLWTLWCCYCGEAMSFENYTDVLEFLDFHTTYCQSYFFFEITL
jgi:hypothetical protein